MDKRNCWSIKRKQTGSQAKGIACRKLKTDAIEELDFMEPAIEETRRLGIQRRQTAGGQPVRFSVHERELKFQAKILSDKATFQCNYFFNVEVISK